MVICQYQQTAQRPLHLSPTHTMETTSLQRLPKCKELFHRRYLIILCLHQRNLILKDHWVPRHHRLMKHLWCVENCCVGNRVIIFLQPSHLTIKVHYNTTRALRVASDCTHEELIKLVCKKFEMPQHSLSLWYVKYHCWCALLYVATTEGINVMAR